MDMQADTVVRFILETRSVRGVWVRMKKSYQDVLANHNYDVFGKQLLGESLVASVVLSRTIKLQGRLALQARGEGQLRLLVAECTNDAGVRGILEYATDDRGIVSGAEPASLRQCLGNGYLAVTLLPDNGDSYQGIVPLQGEKLQDCLGEYFLQSEQLATAMWFCCDGEQAVGFLLQALPVNDEDRSEEDWQHIYTLACTIKDEELLSLSCEEMLHRLFHEEDVHLFAGEPVRFQCTCSMERSRNALAVLGRDDLQKIFAERDSVSVDCQFCGKHYQYNEQDMADILGQQSSRLH